MWKHASIMYPHDQSKAESKPFDTPRTPEQYLVHFLHEHESECPRCKYNLRKLTSHYCPECGAELHLTVGTVEPYLRAWLTLVVNLCVGAGLGIVWIIVLLIEREPYHEFRVTIVCGVLCIPAACVAVFGRRRFVRINPKVQWVFAACGMALALISYVSFYLGIAFG